jgi:hypothetical protein
MLVLAVTSTWLILRHHWNCLDSEDPRRLFAREMFDALNFRRYWSPRFLRRPA